MDTSYQNPNDPNFPIIDGVELVIPQRQGTRTTLVYRPSAEAQAWDGVQAPHALGSRFGGFGYAAVRVTGRTVAKIPGDGRYGYRARVTVAVGTEDEETIAAWIVGWDHEQLAAALA